MSLLDQLTAPVQDRSGLSQATFDGLRAVIEKQTGIHFRENKRYLLESQIGRRLSALGLTDYEDLYRDAESRRLLYVGMTRAERQRMATMTNRIAGTPIKAVVT